MLLLLTTFFTRLVQAVVDAPEILEGILDCELKVVVRGQQQLDAFFAKIERGRKPGALADDRRYYEQAKQLQLLLCDGNPDMRIKRLPVEIGTLTSLKHLYLKYNQLAEIPPEIGNLTNLQVLCLSFNQLTSLPPEIGKLTGLRYLHLDHNQLSEVPPEIGDLADLWELDIGGNKLSSISGEIGNLTSLSVLDIQNNKLTSIQVEIGKLKALKRLRFDNNLLTSLPGEIGNLTGLTRLRLDNNRLTSLPGEIGKLRSLNLLDLHNNKLVSLPVEIGNLPNLLVLDLHNNRLASLPVEIGNLPNYVKMAFYGNPIKYIPPKLRKWQFKFFDHLNGGVFLDRPPVPQPDQSGVVTLSHPDERKWFRDELRRSRGFGKQIKHVHYTELLEETVPPQNCGVGCWPTDPGICVREDVFGGKSEPFLTSENKVEKTFTSWDQVDNLQMEFNLWGDKNGELGQVTVLHLANLGLKTIPSFVFACKNLQRLFLENNEIEEVPTIILELTKLTFLQLGNNIIHSLSDSFKELSELREVILDVNPLDDCFPIPDLSRLEHLEFISLDSGVANRLGMEAVFAVDQKTIDSGIPNISVMVKQPVA